MLTTYLFRYRPLLQNAPFRSQIFKIFFASGGKGALTRYQNPANVPERVAGPDMSGRKSGILGDLRRHASQSKSFECDADRRTDVSADCILTETEEKGRDDRSSDWNRGTTRATRASLKARHAQTETDTA